MKTRHGKPRLPDPLTAADLPRLLRRHTPRALVEAERRRTRNDRRKHQRAWLEGVVSEMEAILSDVGVPDSCRDCVWPLGDSSGTEEPTVIVAPPFFGYLRERCDDNGNLTPDASRALWAATVTAAARLALQTREAETRFILGRVLERARNGLEAREIVSRVMRDVRTSHEEPGAVKLRAEIVKRMMDLTDRRGLSIRSAASRLANTPEVKTATKSVRNGRAYTASGIIKIFDRARSTRLKN